MGYVRSFSILKYLTLILTFVGCSPAVVDFAQQPIVRTNSSLLSFTSPAPRTISRTGLTVQGICVNGIDVEISGPGSSAPQIVPCVNKSFTSAVTFSNGDGVKNITATQFSRDTGLLQDNRDFLKDNTPPAIRITGPAVNSLFQGAMTLVGTCETGYPVNIAGSGISGTVVTGCSSGVFSANIVLTAPDGTKNVVASQTDGVGLSASDNRNFLRDATPPAVAITSPAANSVHALGLTLSGTCETGLNVVIAGSGASAPVTVPCAAGSFSSPVNFSPLDGSKSFTATQTDAAGNIGSANRNFIKDTLAPVVTINSPAANTPAPTGLTITGNCEAGLNVVISGTGVASTTSVTCPAGSYSANIVFSAGNGVKSVTATQTDLVGNSGSASRNFVRDDVAPAVAFTSPAAGSTVAASVIVTGTCETGLPVALGGSGLSASISTPCSAGTFSSSVTFTAGDGNKVVTASQTDAAGNLGSASRTFVRDTAAPVVTISNPAAGTAAQSGLTVSGTCENGLTVTLNGAGVSAPVTTSCASGLYSAAITFSAGDGSKPVTASQTDASGNTGSASRSFVRDTVAPAVLITAPAANSFINVSFVISGTCEAGLNVLLNGSGAASPVTTSCAAGTFSATVNVTAADGIKNIVASQTDAAGNTGTDNRNFMKDLTGPLITINTPAPNTTAQTGLTITGNCENAYIVNVGGAGISAPFTVSCVGGNYSTPIVFSAGDGNKLVTVSQTDGAGNTNTDSRTFIRDNTAPVVAFTSPAANAYVGASGTITGTCESGLNVVLNGAGLASAATVSCASGSFSAAVNFSAGDGLKSVTATQTDGAGNIGSASRNFQRDSVAPAIAITLPAAGTVAQTGLTIQGTCEAGLTVNISGTGVSAPSTTACGAGSFSAAITFSAGDGTKNVIVSQTDAAGNSGSDNRNFARDNSGPLLAITAPAANTAAQMGLTISGVCESGYPVNISGAGVSAASSTSCVANAFSAAITFSAGDGTKNVVVTQTDGAGNISTDNRNFVKDTVAPIVTINSPTEGAYVGASTVVSGNCENGLSVVISGSGVALVATTSCAGGNYSVSVSLTAGDGSKQIIATQTDAATNQGSATRNVLRDSVAPAIAFTAPAAGTAAQNGLTVSGTCEAGLTVTLAGTGVSAASTTSCAAGTFTAAITFSAGDGLKTVSASQTDAAGNTGSDSRNFIRDATPPAIAITSPAAGSYHNSGITISGTCESGLAVNLSGTGLSAASSTSCVGNSFSAAISFSAGDGAKNIIASQTDAVGNSASDNRTFNYDTTAPVITITSPAAGANVAATFVLTGTCETGLTVGISGAGVSSASTTSCVGGNFSTSVNASAGPGNKDVMVAQADLAGNVGSASRTFVVALSNGYESFIPNPLGAGAKRVDILFVDDNSASMETEQQALGNRFTSFINELSGVDWQIGITTTDVSIGIHGIQGSLLTLAGRSDKILLPTTPNADMVFKNTIERPETLNCIMTGTCPSGLEQPLRASMMAMDKRNTDNVGFFRPDADLAVVILSDEDEMSDGRPTSTTGQAVIDHARSIWPTKKITGYAIVIQPGDTACLAEQGAQFGATAYYGTRATQFANLTGGVTGDICLDDYAPTLSTIGQNIVELTNSVQLSRIPLPGTVSVTFTPAQAITWVVAGDKVIFSAPPAPGTLVEVYYNY